MESASDQSDQAENERDERSIKYHFWEGGSERERELKDVCSSDNILFSFPLKKDLIIITIKVMTNRIILNLIYKAQVMHKMQHKVLNQEQIIIAFTIKQ